MTGPSPFPNPSKVRQPYINNQNAAELARKSHEARRLQKAQLEAYRAEASPDQQYVAARIAQVRTQIDAINERISQEEDPMKLDRLVNAVYRLTELERVLSGRPLPGQLKPIASRATRPDAEPLR